MSAPQQSHGPLRAPRLSDLSPATVAAGFIAVLVSYSGPLLLYFEAARALGVGVETFSSWVFAISMAAGISSIGLSLWLRMPVVTAWSAPGTALLIAGGAGVPFAEITGAFLFAAGVIFLIGVSGLFERATALIPTPVSDGMMAGILFGFGLKAMRGLEAAPGLFAALLAGYLLLTALAPRIALVLLLAASAAWTFTLGGVETDGLQWALAAPRVTWPVFSFDTIMSFGIPLAVITLSGQHLPGLAVLRAFGYRPQARPIIIATSLLSVPSALLGGIVTAPAAITAAICAGPEAHPDPARRWAAAAMNGVFYLLGGLFAGTILQLLALLPGTLISMLAGLALLGAVQGGMARMLADKDGALAGLLAFMVTVSGATLFGVGAAFWGVIVGTAALHLRRGGGALARALGRG